MDLLGQADVRVAIYRLAVLGEALPCLATGVLELRGGSADAVDGITMIDGGLSMLVTLACRLHLYHIHLHAWRVHVYGYRLRFRHDETERCTGRLRQWPHHLCQASVRS